jgi:hypothetical protein
MFLPRPSLSMARGSVAPARVGAGCSQPPGDSNADARKSSPDDHIARALPSACEMTSNALGASVASVTGCAQLGRSWARVYARSAWAPVASRSWARTVRLPWRSIASAVRSMAASAMAVSTGPQMPSQVRTRQIWRSAAPASVHSADSAVPPSLAKSTCAASPDSGATDNMFQRRTSTVTVRSMAPARAVMTVVPEARPCTRPAASTVAIVVSDERQVASVVTS